MGVPYPAPETKSALARDEIVRAARSWLGTPYLHQASAKGRGADCLGLIRGLYTELLGREPEAPPPYAADWNERRPGEEPLLAAARRHLIEVAGSRPRVADETGAFPPLEKGGRKFAKRISGGIASGPVLIPPGGFAAAPPLQGGESPRETYASQPATCSLQPGQVLVFRIVKTGPAKHCGVVSASDRFIHAYAGRCVIESWLARFWKERVAGVFEFPGVEE